jgi:uncharacterized protein related to proFAR isomerase
MSCGKINGGSEKNSGCENFYYFTVLREHPVYIGGGIVGERVRKHKTHPF